MQRTRVECYSGYRADERPLRFCIGDLIYSVERLDDKWYSPCATYFRVIAGDGNTYVLRHGEADDIWSIEAFRATSGKS
ncbi:MAG TPA: hypothetical protein VGR81_01420 [Candidatus Acidoferrales bacterium]|nr:hypothetical protein [Candidatus Acidoferrales bacterium]